MRGEHKREANSVVSMMFLKRFGRQLWYFFYIFRLKRYSDHGRVKRKIYLDCLTFFAFKTCLRHSMMEQHCRQTTPHSSAFQSLVTCLPKHKTMHNVAVTSRNRAVVKHLCRPVYIILFKRDDNLLFHLFPWYIGLPVGIWFSSIFL